ncbi:MAG: hypothetical protein IPI90_19605 [Saprospiraceae bacterium]|nr:hypothetical protein [Candidatus Vicinibacter affinis]
MLVSAQNRSIDGWEFISAIQDGTHFNHVFISTLSQAEKDKLQVVLVEFKSKYDHLFFNVSNILHLGQQNSWNITFNAGQKYGYQQR